MASNMSVEMLNDVKVYNLSSGKTLPEWLPERQRRQVANSDEFRQRIEIIQDFDFPVGSQRIQLSRDNNYVIATGTYKPRVKVWEFAEMSLKFERYLDSGVTQFYQLSDDFRKLVFLTEDRTLEFHAAWGTYYKVRIPKFGRDLAYHRSRCDMYVSVRVFVRVCTGCNFECCGAFFVVVVFGFVSLCDGTLSSTCSGNKRYQRSIVSTTTNTT